MKGISFWGSLRAQKRKAYWELVNITVGIWVACCNGSGVERGGDGGGRSYTQTKGSGKFKNRM